MLSLLPIVGGPAKAIHGRLIPRIAVRSDRVRTRPGDLALVHHRIAPRFSRISLLTSERSGYSILWPFIAVNVLFASIFCCCQPKIGPLDHRKEGHLVVGAVGGVIEIRSPELPEGALVEVIVLLETRDTGPLG